MNELTYPTYPSHYHMCYLKPEAEICSSEARKLSGKMQTNPATTTQSDSPDNITLGPMNGGTTCMYKKRWLNNPSELRNYRPHSSSSVNESAISLIEPGMSSEPLGEELSTVPAIQAPTCMSRLNTQNSNGRVLKTPRKGHCGENKFEEPSPFSDKNFIIQWMLFYFQLSSMHFSFLLGKGLWN